jgi:hypothetical protein
MRIGKGTYVARGVDLVSLFALILNRNDDLSHRPPLVEILRDSKSHNISGLDSLFA